jgi:hypothetical protein
MPGIPFHTGHRGAHHRQVDLVVKTVQNLIGIAQRGVAMPAGHRPGGHRFVGIAGQRTATAFAAEVVLAWSDTLGFIRLVRLLPFGRRQAGTASTCFSKTLRTGPSYPVK